MLREVRTNLHKVISLIICIRFIYPKDICLMTMIVLLWYQFSFLWKGPKIKLKSGVFQCFRPCVWCQINLGCVSFGSTQTCDLPLFLRVKDVFQILRRVPLLLCFLSTEFVLSRVQSTEYRAQSAKCSDYSAAEPSSPSVGARSAVGRMVTVAFRNICQM